MRNVEKSMFSSLMKEGIHIMILGRMKFLGRYSVER